MMIKKPIYYGIGLFATKGLSLLMLPVLANHLSVQELGRLELLTSISVCLGIVLGGSLHEALYRYAGQEKSMDKQFNVASQIFSLASIISLLSLSLLISIAIFLSSSLPYIHVEELLLIFIGVSVEGLLSLLLAWLRMQDNTLAFVKITVSTCILQLGMVVFSLWLNFGIIGILMASVIAHIIELIWLHAICQLTLTLPQSERSKVFLRYSIPMCISGLLAFALNGAERWVIAITDNVENLARYAIAAKFTLAMCILVQPFGMWWMPKRFMTFEHSGATDTVKYTQYGLIWIAILCAFMAYFAPLFITLALPETYQFSSQLVIFCLFAAMLKEITELTNLGLLIHKKTTQLFRINLIATIIGLIFMALLQHFSILGILTALIGAQLIRMIMITSASQQLIALPYRTKSLFILYLICAGLMLLSPFITRWEIQSVMCVIAPVVVFSVAAILKLIPTKIAQRSNQVITKARITHS